MRCRMHAFGEPAGRGDLDVRALAGVRQHLAHDREPFSSTPLT